MLIPDGMLDLEAAPRLEIRDLRRVFGDREAVRGVSLKVAAGQVTCLLGPSGCGKSTTLRMIAGVEMQDSGEIYLDGTLLCDTVFRVPPERREIGLMFQDFALFPHLSVADNVGFGLPRGGDREARVLALLDRVGLAAYANAYPDQLSGGEQQRVALARAIAPQPKVMLMDEPFSGLDERLRDDVRDTTLRLLREEGTAVVLVTHEPAEAMRMADEIALMRQGQIVQQGAPYAVYNAPVDRDAAAFFSDINVIPACVEGALARTPFGEFLAPGHEDGTQIDIVIRPQHLKVDFDRAGTGPSPTPSMGQAAKATVQRARFLGHYSLVDFALEGGLVLTASIPSVFLPAAGTPFWLLAPRKNCYVFPKP